MQLRWRVKIKPRPPFVPPANCIRTGSKYSTMVAKNSALFEYSVHCTRHENSERNFEYTRCAVRRAKVKCSRKKRRWSFYSVFTPSTRHNHRYRYIDIADIYIWAQRRRRRPSKLQTRSRFRCRQREVSVNCRFERWAIEQKSDSPPTVDFPASRPFAFSLYLSLPRSFCLAANFLGGAAWVKPPVFSKVIDFSIRRSTSIYTGVFSGKTNDN